MARSSRAKRRGNVVTVNFKGVEGRILIPEGQYHVKVAEVTQEDGAAAPYLKWKFEIVSGKFEGKPLYNNTSLSEQSLWNLRNLLETLGIEIPDDEMDLDLEDYVGKECMLTVAHEDYEGRNRARVTDFAPIAEEDEDDEPKAKKKRGSKRRDDDEVPMDEEDEAPKSRKGKRRPADEEEEDEDDEPRSRKKSRGKPARDEEDEEDEEDEAPKSRKKAGKKKELPTAEEISDMGEDELEDVVTEFKLRVNLDKLRTLTKKQNAVSDALEDLAA